MLDPKTLDDMARKFADALPAGVRAFQEDMEKHIRASLQSMFERLDLVTREEFDVQTQVLAKTREKVEALEAIVARLEADRSGSPNDGDSD